MGCVRRPHRRRAKARRSALVDAPPWEGGRRWCRDCGVRADVLARSVPSPDRSESRPARASGTHSNPDGRRCARLSWSRWLGARRSSYQGEVGPGPREARHTILGEPVDLSVRPHRPGTRRAMDGQMDPRQEIARSGPGSPFRRRRYRTFRISAMKKTSTSLYPGRTPRTSSR